MRDEFFNLLNNCSLEEALKNTVPCLRGYTVDSINKAMDQFRVLKTNPNFFNFKSDGLCTISGNGWSEAIKVENMLRTGEMLSRLSRYENFNSFAPSFNNPEQFTATMFEINCCDTFVREFSVQNLEFEPEHDVNGTIKRPEFKAIMEDGQVIFGECKSLASLNGLRSSRAMKIKELIFDKILPLVPDKRRLEISFKVLPRHWNRNYTNQLFGAIDQLVKNDFKKQHLELIIDQSHKTWIKLCDQHESQFFNNIINVSDKIMSKFPKLILGECSNIKKDIKSLIKDAMTQLSADSYSTIFLYSLNESFATEAISEFIRDNEPANLLGIFSWTKSLKFHRNLLCKIDLNDYSRIHS